MLPHPRSPGPVLLAALLASSLLAAACGGSSSKPATLTAIAVVPATGYVGTGRTLQLAATGTFSDATNRDVTAEVAWSSSDAGVATVSDAAGTKGLVTGGAQGPVTVTAASGAVAGAAALTTTAVVDTAGDAVAADGHCSLREALLNAAAMDQSGSAECAAGNGQDVIRFDLAFPATIALAAQLPAIVHQVAILGPQGQQLGLFGDDAVRFFQVGSGASLELSDLTLLNGSATQGGAVLVAGGTLELERVTFQTSGATGTPSGGAIANLAGTVTASSSTFSGSYALRDGGAIYNATGGTMLLDGCVFDGNHTDGNGGAIYNQGTLTVAGSAFEGNTADYSSGAISNVGGTLAVATSTFTGNTAYTGGGAILNYQGGTASVTSCTFALNSAGAWGGGAIFNGVSASSLAVTYTTLSANAAAGISGAIANGGHGDTGGTVSLTATLLSYNRIAGTTVNCYNQSGATFLDGGFNLEDGDTCTLGAGSWKSTDPGPLEPADNGGGTRTMALSAASPALDRIPAGSAGCGTTVAADQRGVARPQGSGCDVGAYERE
jgi:predicted outer membrane repeat protein